MTPIEIADPAVPRLIVTGHPNHELAILGFVQRTRPRLLFLTDGGGGRVAESRQALGGLGLADRARFLGWPEPRLYRALLERDVALFAELVAKVRDAIVETAPRQIVCESVELYNPLHDITLPIVRAASRGLNGIEIVEFPLIAEVPGGGERFRVQRLPGSRAGIALRLSAGELAAKLAARDGQYRSLRHQLGAVLDGVAPEEAALEVFAAAEDAFPTPGESHALRYERRGRELQERGEVAEVITYRDHFLPTVTAL